MTETAAKPEQTDTITPAPTAKQRRDYWRNQAIVRQRIIDKQDKTIANLTASVVQLESDYDAVEAKLNEAEDLLQKATRPVLKTSRAW